MERQEVVIPAGEDPHLVLGALRKGGWRLESYRTARADQLWSDPAPVLLPRGQPSGGDPVVLVLECVKGGVA
jgi:hypothetical protein